VKAPDTTSTNLALWLALFAGPVAWTLHLLVSYALVKVACEANVALLLHLVTLATLALAVLGLAIAVRAYGLRWQPPRTASDFLWVTSMLVNLVFAFGILMEGLPNAVVSPCL
jgi:hypothetical protein